MNSNSVKNGIQIGGVLLPHPFFMAPLAGFTDAAFRLIASEEGAALTYSEMISAKGMAYGDRGSKELLEVAEGEGPTAAQLFGHEEYYIRRGVQLLDERDREKPEELRHKIIDINMGCPVPKVVKNGEGSALMNDRFTAAAVVRAAVIAEKELAEKAGRLPRPVTVKCRLGWDAETRDAVLDFAPAMEEAGASAVCVHGRTREQFYSGEADWEMIGKTKERLSIPLIGSGDLFTAESGVSRIRDGYCDAVMYARGGLGNPWIFRESLALLNGLPNNDVTPEERRTMMNRHLDLVVELKGEHRAVLEMRKLWGFYMKGLRGAVEIRRRVNSLETAAELRTLLDSVDLENR